MTVVDNQGAARTSEAAAFSTGLMDPTIGVALAQRLGGPASR
nr:hypothetical protein [Motilibacter aurantiacus]